VRRSECEPRVFRQRIDRLHQSFAERGLAQHPRAIVILQRARHDLGCRSRHSVHQDDDGIVISAIAVSGTIDLFRRSAPAMRNDSLVLLQELVRHRDALVE
jgi:hypothetical protein